MLRQLLRRLFGADVLTVLFSLALAALTLAFARRVPEWRLVVAVSAAIALGLPLLALVRARVRSRLIDFLHDWAFAPLAYVLYLEMHLVVGPIRGGWVADPTLIAIDRWLFGTDAGLLMARIASPPLTEVLQIAYTSFYALVVAVGAELYVKGELRRFHLYAFSCAIGFLASFVGYLAVPAVGPRFTVFDYFTVARDLPGLYFTPALRRFVDGGGFVPAGVPLAQVVAFAPRDVFPSGHTMMTLVAIFWTWRFRERIRWPITVIGALLIVGTVYLRYHYVVDLLAGGVLAAACVACTPASNRWMITRVGARDL